MYKILVVEDDQDIAQLLKLHLGSLDYEVAITQDGCNGLQQALSGSYDLIILDLMLPRMEGLEICRQIRSKANYVPILMLTARSSELERVLGLEMGADDYLTKPFSIPEFLARVKSLFRRLELLKSSPAPEQGKSIAADGLIIHVESRTVTLHGKSVDLTAKEFDLLAHFVHHPGRVFTRSQLLSIVWGSLHQGYQHTVNSHINRLRAKIENNPANPSYILTVWGVGYKFRDIE